MLHGPHKRRELIKCYSDDEDVESEIPHLIVKNRAEATRVLSLLWVAVICIMAAVSFMGYSIYTDNSQGRTGSNAYGANSASNASSVKPRQRERGNTFADSLLQLEINPMEVLQKTVTPRLPGIYHMSKVYNLFVGKPVYELYGIDVIDFTYGDDETMINDASYSVPSEFRSVPNVDPSCDVESSVSSVYYSSSSSVLEEQGKSMSGGYEAEYDWSGGVEIDGVSGSVDTSTRNAAMFGHSSTSKDGRSKASEDYSWSFSLEASTKLYKAEIDWSSEDTFVWKDSFIASLRALDANPSNKTIMSFIHKWGTHVLTTAQTGSYCHETAYVEGSASETSVEEFRSKVNSQSFGYGFWSADRSKSESEAKSGKIDEQSSYMFGNIYCVGEVQMTSSACAAQTAEQNNPVITSYVPFPVWQINDVQSILTRQTIENFAYFIFLLLDSLEECGTVVCRDSGSCTLDEEIWTSQFIEEWDGLDFDAMWNAIDNEYCFCEAGKMSPDCDACLCYGDEDCCCYNEAIVEDGGASHANNTCEADLLCAPDNKCIAEKINVAECGERGEFIHCESGKGFVVMTCGSGKLHDCHKTGVCAQESSTALRCGYEDLGAWGEPEWICSGEGRAVSCIDSEIGKILGGICGSGSDQDCQHPCVGNNAVLCVPIEGVTIDSGTCKWVYQSEHGGFVQCDDGYVGTGFCASGNDKDCTGNSNAIQCCKILYS